MDHNPDKLRLAAGAGGPAARCKAGPGLFRPEVDSHRCEGSGDCMKVCPYNVFEVGRLGDAAFRALPLRLKLKSWAHGRRTAYTPGAEGCRACGLCVAVCPEGAIRIVALPV